jgi:hypothetical protein
MDKVKNKWTWKERDQFMDLVLDGRTSGAIAEELGRDEAFIKAQFRPTFYPAEPYIAYGRRKSRVGMKMTQLELQIVQKHHEMGYPTAHTAKMLARTPNEICPDYYGKITFNQMRCLAPVSDQVLAHHYLYHANKTPIITDQAYDDAKAEEIEFGGGGPLLHALAKTNGKVTDYPPHIRSLAFYMLYKFMEVTGEWNDRVLPYSWGLERKQNET